MSVSSYLEYCVKYDQKEQKGVQNGYWHVSVTKNSEEPNLDDRRQSALSKKKQVRPLEVL